VVNADAGLVLARNISLGCGALAAFRSDTSALAPQLQ
jgi:hypothetical protein